MKHKTVIFDLFGTLIDNWTLPDYHRVVSEIAAKLQVDTGPLQRMLQEHLEDNMRGSFASLEEFYEQVYHVAGQTSRPTHVSEAAEIWSQFVQQLLSAPRQDAAETISRIKASGLSVGLITNAGVELPDLWPQSDLAPLIGEAVISCAVRMTKPDPPIYRLVCDHLSVQPQECLYVGDGGSNELTGAEQVGMQAVKISVPGDAFAEANAQDWDGPTISALSQMLALIR